MSNALNLQSINQEEAFNLACFNIRTQQNMLMLGQKGTGKTMLFLQAIKECGYTVNYLNLSVLDRSDLLGLPNMFDKGDVITYKSPHYLPTLDKTETPNQVILFDEVDKCDQSNTAPLLEILQFRKLNGKPINAVCCLLTGNLLNEGAYSNRISSPILDRCSKFLLEFNLQRWISWAQLNGVYGLIIGFLQSHPEFACGEIESTLLASPSPRGWTLASEAILQAKEHKITDIKTITNIIAGYVGSNAALAFETWYAYSKEFEQYMPTILEFGHCSLEFNKLDPTQQLVFAITLCSLCKGKILISSHKKRIKYLDNVSRYFILAGVPKEIQQVAFSNSFPFEFIAKYKLFEAKSFFAVVEKLQEGIKVA